MVVFHARVDQPRTFLIDGPVVYNLEKKICQTLKWFESSSKDHKENIFIYSYEQLTKTLTDAH